MREVAERHIDASHELTQDMMIIDYLAVRMNEQDSRKESPLNASKTSGFELDSECVHELDSEE
jgi:hypothetical protein